jgi:hypothetical protein
MNSAELAAVVFAACNGVRVLAYFPQIIRLMRDRDVCKGVSFLTWGGFAAANLSTVVYALVAIADWNMAVVFGVNLAFCLAIVLLVCWKRCSFRILSRKGDVPQDQPLAHGNAEFTYPW